MLGTTVSHFQILRKLGQGGMGEVYLAQDTLLPRQVALKFPGSGPVGHGDMAKRLRLEAQAAAGLSHPSIAAIHEIGEHQGQPFLVLEYVEGETLEACLRRGPLPVDTAVRYAEAIADALAHAHGRGIIHRDLKPNNIMLTPRGDLKILDLGLARSPEASQITRPGAQLGTVTHLSAEQAAGQPADARSDLWALGVVLYQCLTGVLPFGAEHDAVILDRIRTADPPAPSSLRAGVPPRLDRIVLRCLEKNPAKRYQSAAEVAADLGHVDGQLVRRSPGAPWWTWAGGARWSRRAIAQAVVVGGLLLAMAVLGRGVLVRGSRAGHPAAGKESVLAIAGFTFRGAPELQQTAYALTALVRTGLSDASACRVIGETHMDDLRRRQRTSAGIGASVDAGTGALSLARMAGASTMVTGEISRQGQQLVARWRLVEVDRGDALLETTSSGAGLQEVAQAIVRASAGLLQDICPGEGPLSSRSVRDLTTNSERAYQHFAIGRLLDDEGKNADAAREYQQAIAIETRSRSPTTA